MEDYGKLTFALGWRAASEHRVVGQGLHSENRGGAVSLGEFHTHILDLGARESAHVEVKVHAGIEVFLCD